MANPFTFILKMLFGWFNNLDEDRKKQVILAMAQGFEVLLRAFYNACKAYKASKADAADKAERSAP